MASTIFTYNLEAGRTKFPVNFEYLARRFVKITLVGATRRELVLNVDYRFTSKMEIETTVVWLPGQYVSLEVRRVTSATDRLVNFTDGSILRSQDLNISQIQAIHIAEEGRAASDVSLINNGSSWDAYGLPIKNVGYPVDKGDAATVGFVGDELARTIRAGRGVNLNEIPADRANRVLGFDAEGQPTVLIPSSGSAAEILIDLKTGGVAGKGGDMVAAKRTALHKALKTSADAFNVSRVSVWETAHLAIGYTEGGDMNTWDWAPAINAASELALFMKAGVVEFTAHRFRVRSPVRRYDGVNFEGRGSMKGDTSKHDVYDVSCIANEVNSETVMESQGLTSGRKNIIAHMRGMKVLGNPLTEVVLDLKGFWLSKFDEVYIGGGKTTVWARSDFPNGFNCYYCQFTNSMISGLNLNNYDNMTNVYGLRLTDDADEFFIDGVNIINATNSLSVESRSYCHGGYVNIEYSSVNHTPIFMNSPNCVISDLRCDPHRPMTRPFLHLGPLSRNNRINLKTFESDRITQLMEYYVKDEGRFNDIGAGQYFSDWTQSRNLLLNPNFLGVTAARAGWTKTNSVEYVDGGTHKTKRVTTLRLTAAETLANATATLAIPVSQLTLGDTVVLDMYIKVDSPAAMLGFSDSNGLIKSDGSISGQVLAVPNTAGKFVRARRAFVLTVLPVGVLRLQVYPCRSATATIVPTIGDSVSISDLGVDIVDPYSHTAPSGLDVEGTNVMLSDITFAIGGNGLVLVTPDGTKKYKVSVSNAGVLTTTLI